MTPRVSVVMLTRDRPDRLVRALASLRAQTLPATDYEIVIVDDASGPATVSLLERERAAPGPPIVLVRHDEPGGVSRGRNDGVAVARAPLIAFTDDDCEAAPGWLEAGLTAWAEVPTRFVQGPTRPNPAEAHLENAFAHTVRVESLGPHFETANIFYPRAALERFGGFDAESFGRWGGEDTDLAWRLIGEGFEPVWAPDALVHHAVTPVDARTLLRQAWRWDGPMLVLKRYPHLRSNLTLRVFWSPTHWNLVLALVALALPSRVWWLRWWLAAPYMLRLGTLRPDRVAVLFASDVLEIAACARGGARHRVLVL